MTIKFIDGLNRRIFDSIVEVYLGDRPALLVDAEGNSLIGEKPAAPQISGAAIADRTYSVGGDVVTIDARDRFTGATSYSMTPANLPGVSWDGVLITIDPQTVIAETEITLRGINAGGESDPLVFSLTINAADPVLIQPLPDLSLTRGSGDRVIALGDHFTGASSYTIVPMGAGVTLTGATMTISAAADRNASYTVTARNSTGQSLSDEFALVVAPEAAPDPGAGEPAAIDSVVVIGASHENNMFKKDLVTPNESATNYLSSLGHDLPVYGYATGGETMAAARQHYEAARAAHPNAIIISGFGGNDVSQERPYPGGDSTIEARLADLLVAAAGDTRFYQANVTFRDYGDAAFQDQAIGSRPYNDAIYEPWIRANFPHAWASYDRPVLDFYRITIANYETWLTTDNVHMTSLGYSSFRGWILDRVAEILEGREPAELEDRVYVEPGPIETPEGTFVIVNIGEGVGYNNIKPALEGMSMPVLYGVTGEATDLSADFTFNEEVRWGTTNPAIDYNATGRPAGALYNGQLLADEITLTQMHVTQTVAMTITISGAIPGESYELAWVGSRATSGYRGTDMIIDGETTRWNAAEDPVVEYKRTTVADANGQLVMILDSEPTISFGHLSGFSIRHLASV